jgi:hypothetical protein
LGERKITAAPMVRPRLSVTVYAMPHAVVQEINEITNARCLSIRYSVDFDVGVYCLDGERRYTASI